VEITACCSIASWHVSHLPSVSNAPLFKDEFLVVVAPRSHPFPFSTGSNPAPMQFKMQNKCTTTPYDYFSSRSFVAGRAFGTRACHGQTGHSLVYGLQHKFKMKMVILEVIVCERAG